MRQIDHMTPEEIDALKLKGMLPEKRWIGAIPDRDELIDANRELRAHAERLAEVCREFVRVMQNPKTTAAMPHTVAMAREALAEWEKAR